MAEATFEPRVGGAVSFRWEGSGECSGIVSIFDPPRVLEYSWVEGDATSVVRFELRPGATGVVLVLDHRELPPRAHAGVGAGWHTHLDALGAVLAGEPTLDFWARFHALEPQYSKLVAEL
jgi:uncharacterized protein YndB with AHSA1/START domain